MKTKYNKKQPLLKTLLGFIIILSTSCQKVITLDLGSSDSQLVVEANITDQPGPYIVKLSKSVSFDNVNSIPMVSGAKVVISDSSGNSDTLFEKKAGVYITRTLQGTPGHTYKLSILSEGKSYEAFSHMPYPVDSFKLTVTTEASTGRIGLGRGGDTSKRYQINFDITDPAQYTNYYRFVNYRGGRQLNSRRVYNDQSHNGKHIIDQFNLNDSVAFYPGDTVIVTLQNIDQAVYNFYSTLRTGAGGLGFLSATPANPNSNVSGNGLGYFSAYSVRSRKIVIPK